jgi:hypothetical protein
MKWNTVAIISLALLTLVSGAMACHYWCGENNGIDPTTAPDVTAYPGQTLTFAGQDSRADYSFAWHNEGGWTPIGVIGTTHGTGTITWKVPVTAPYTSSALCGQTRYYTVTWTGSINNEADPNCVLKGCIKIKVDGPCATCPVYPTACQGHFADTNTPTVTLPSWMTSNSATVEYTMPGLTGTYGNGAALPSGYYNGLLSANSPYTPVMNIKIGATIVQTCNTNTIVVRPTPTGTVTVS